MSFPKYIALRLIRAVMIPCCILQGIPLVFGGHPETRVLCYQETYASLYGKGLHIFVGNGVKQSKEGHICLCRFPCGADGRGLLPGSSPFWELLSPTGEVFPYCTGP